MVVQTFTQWLHHQSPLTSNSQKVVTNSIWNHINWCQLTAFTWPGKATGLYLLSLGGWCKLSLTDLAWHYKDRCPWLRRHNCNCNWKTGRHVRNCKHDLESHIGKALLNIEQTDRNKNKQTWNFAFGQRTGIYRKWRVALTVKSKRRTLDWDLECEELWVTGVNG